MFWLICTICIFAINIHEEEEIRRNYRVREKKESEKEYSLFLEVTTPYELLEFHIHMFSQLAFYHNPLILCTVCHYIATEKKLMKSVIA